MNQTIQDNAIKKTLDNLAQKYGYPAGVLDSDKGTLTYDVSTPVFGLEEAKNRVYFRVDIFNALQHQPNMTITAHYTQVTIKLPDWENLNSQEA